MVVYVTSFLPICSPTSYIFAFLSTFWLLLACRAFAFLFKTWVLSKGMGSLNSWSSLGGSSTYFKGSYSVDKSTSVLAGVVITGVETIGGNSFTF